LPCAVAIVGAYTFLPPLIDGLIARSLQDGLGLVDAPRVDLESDPAPEMLLGEFQGGEVTLADPDLGGVRPDEVSVDLEPFDLDVPGSVADRRIQSKGPLSGTFRAELSEEEVARIAASSDTAVAPVRSVRFEEGYAVLGSEAEVLGTRVPVDVEGDVDLGDGELRFVPERLEMLGTPLPDRLSRELLRGVSFAYPIVLPFRGEVSTLQVHEGRLVLGGEARDLPLG
jgi:LmeA-like phospholipid-binding